jgi:hypothetical protein
MKILSVFTALLTLTIVVGFSGEAMAESDQTATVPGTASVNLAGQSQSDLETAIPPEPGAFNVCWTIGNGTNHSVLHNDTADWEGVERALGGCPIASGPFSSVGSAIVPPSVDICGESVVIGATGAWAHGPMSGQISGPDGRASLNSTHSEYGQFNISLLLNMNLNALTGVFLTDSPPAAGSLDHPLPKPADLSGLGAYTTTPALQQAFAIGAAATVDVPAGATRLFFGLHDGYEWWNNGGEVEVHVTTVVDCTPDINVKPGSDPNSINTCSGGAVPVAVFGSAGLDVTTLNPDQLVLASSSVKTVGKSMRSLCSIEDIGAPDGAYFDDLGDPDGFDDLVCHFVTVDLDVSDASMEAELTMTGCDGGSGSGTNGECLSGDAGYYQISASDAVSIVKDCE